MRLRPLCRGQRSVAEEDAPPPVYRTERFIFRLTREEKLILLAKARSQRMSVSMFVRNAAMRACGPRRKPVKLGDEA
jgi:hypothetical protein